MRLKISQGYDILFIKGDEGSPRLFISFIRRYISWLIRSMTIASAAALAQISAP
jgi:hypothetical protein